jgi:hypothetical protein
MLYAVGDIHGELDKLEELLTALPLRRGDRLVFLGDYVDRGPASYDVVQRLVTLQREWPCEFLLGNHESMLLDFLGWTDDAYFGGDAFLMNGGDRTLATYGYFDQERPDRKSFKLPKDHEEFLLSLKRHHREGGAASLPDRGHAVEPHDLRAAPQPPRDHRLRPHAQRGVRGPLEPALQHRHRHRRGLRRASHGDSAAGRDPLPGLSARTALPSRPAL